MRSILGIDTASPHGSVALALDGECGAAEPLLPGAHSSGLSRSVERVLEARGLGWASLTGIAVSEGPGSFTGLRIGLAWAKGFAMGRALPLALVSAHEAAAHAHRGAATRVATLAPAERGRVSAAIWVPGPWPSVAWGPESVPEDDLLEALAAASSGAALAIAAPSEALAALVEDQEGRLLPRLPLAPAVAALGDRMLREGRSADLAAAAPAYGRAANARKPGSSPR